MGETGPEGNGSWTLGLPQDKFFFPRRFLTVTGPVEGPESPKATKDIRIRFPQGSLPPWRR
eukprot:5652011-Pyramimonas_sp.AAC.1